MFRKRIISRIRPPWFPATWNNKCVIHGGLEKILGEFYGGDVYMVGAARQGLDLVLQAIGVRTNDMIVMSDYNCSCMVEPLGRYGCHPEFVDIKSDFSFDVSQLSEKIRCSHVKVLIVTHFFGESCWTDELKELVGTFKAKGGIVIEDCAHSLFDSLQPEIGRVGDVALFSFGNDKPASVGKAGAIVVHSNELSVKIRKIYCQLPIRSLSEERLLFTWYLVYLALSDPTRCFYGLSCEAPDVHTLDETKFLELLNNLPGVPSLISTKTFPCLTNLFDNAMSQERKWFRRAFSRLSAIIGFKLLDSRLVNISVSPVRMNVLAHDLLSILLSSGKIEECNRVRARNASLISNGIGEGNICGSRLRYSITFESEKWAVSAEKMARKNGIEVGCYNWRPFLSSKLGLVRKHPSWSIKPNCTLNFPCHDSLSQNDIDLIIKIIRRNKV